MLISNNNAFEISSSIDSNITPENIKKDVIILGVTGTYEGNGGGGNTEYEFKFYNMVSQKPTTSQDL